jgi:hypothetical protein
VKRTFRLIACALGIGLLGACSHKNANAPLSYAPADTPYLMANLKPMDADTRASMYKLANMQLPMQVSQMRQAAKKLDDAHMPRMAGLFRAMSNEFEGRTIQQIIKREGFKPDGLFAFYGIGMSPVVRSQLADPAAFNAFVGRLEKAMGASMDSAKIGSTDYRQVVFGSKIKLRFIVAVEHKQAVLALLPADADTSLLRSVLGLDKPKQSVQGSRKLAKLADANGYKPYSLAYIDLSQWPALIAGEKDPMVKALLAPVPQAAEKIPASCQADFARITARMPMISFGMTGIGDTHMGYRLNVDLAADITKAFADIDVKLPGLDGKDGAPLDIALALPVKEFRTFWMKQAEAVASKPFTCPALTGLNNGFAKLRMNLIKTAMPPINDLRGVRVALDSLELPSQGASVSKPMVSGRVLIASDNPEGLVSMAQLAAPPLRKLKLSGQPAWVAMNKHLLGIAIGAGEDQSLAKSMGKSVKARGMIGTFHVNGVFYRKWIMAMTSRMGKAMQKMAENDKDPNAKAMAEDFQHNMQALQKQAEHIDGISERFRMDKHGMVIDAEQRFH